MAQVVSAETARRLRWHAGFEQMPGASVHSISECTWPPNDLHEALRPALDDFVAVLETLNHELNGAVPSESADSAEVIPTDVVYAVAEVGRQLRKYEEARRTSDLTAGGAPASWIVDTAWLAVLAGDIDDVREHVQQEGMYKG